MEDVKIIDGEIFIDEIGQISSLNDFRFTGVERFYVIHHPNTDVIRGWNGHKIEKKWFYCLNGSFHIGTVAIDDWDNPSKDLQPTIHSISSDKSQIICVPEGYANCIKATKQNSILLVLSSKTLNEARFDNWRYDVNYWFDWSEIK